MSNEHVNAVIRSTLDAIFPPAEKQVAQCGVEVSDDQTSVLATRRLEFVEEVSAEGRICGKCVANDDNDLCGSLPCSEHTRKDCRAGYWREVHG
jgi:hypothetical protein